MPAAPRKYLIVAPKSLPASPLAAHRKYLIVVPRPLLRCASQVLGRGAQAYARGAALVLDRGAQAVFRGAAALPQQEQNNSADLQQHRVNITGFICTVARPTSQRYTFGEFESLAVASRRRRRRLQYLLRRPRLLHKTLALPGAGV
jgi:hypothetical protein